MGSTEFGEIAARTACNELYGDPAVAFFAVNKNCHYNDYWTNKVVCDDIEEEIKDCHHEDWGTVSLDNNSTCVMLKCSAAGPVIDPPTEPEEDTTHVDEAPVEIIPPGMLTHNERTGILSFTYNVEDRAVCDDKFGQKEAEVACMELYGNSSVIGFSVGHECDYKKFWLSDVKCTGEEPVYDQCEHLTYGVHNCDWTRECIELFCGAGGP